MTHKPEYPSVSLIRRRLLQGTLSSAAGLAAWHQGWPWLRTAAAQPCHGHVLPRTHGGARWGSRPALLLTVPYPLQHFLDHLAQLLSAEGFAEDGCPCPL